MKTIQVSFIAVLVLSFLGAFRLTRQKPADDSLKNYCVSQADKKLYDLLMAYRKSFRLDSIPLSKSLSYVAFSHTMDLSLNRPDQKPCNMHSWSNKGSWKPCCYTPDHKKAACKWDKPHEIAGFSGDGFEIAAYYSGRETAEMALSQWKGSPGLHAVMANKGMWAGKKWKSVGVSIYGNYAVMWFSEITDDLGVSKVSGQ